VVASDHALILPALSALRLRRWLLASFETYGAMGYSPGRPSHGHLLHGRGAPAPTQDADGMMLSVMGLHDARLARSRLRHAFVEPPNRVET
jgi:hypothetical protein